MKIYNSSSQKYLPGQKIRHAKGNGPHGPKSPQLRARWHISTIATYWHIYHLYQNKCTLESTQAVLKPGLTKPRTPVRNAPSPPPWIWTKATYSITFIASKEHHAGRKQKLLQKVPLQHDRPVEAATNRLLSITRVLPDKHYTALMRRINEKSLTARQSGSWEVSCADQRLSVFRYLYSD